jgi:membrane-bound metal-dependent hydrolase YbcI (DUF457 family)
MPDLLTHYASARLPALALRDDRLQALLVAGAFLPDVVSKGLHWVARAPDHFASPSHSPVGLLLLCYLAALLLAPALRRAGFACLYAGGLLHLALDVLKENVGHGAARLFLPFDLRSVELGWIPMEDVVYLLPFDAVVLIAVVLVERSRRRVL